MAEDGPKNRKTVKSSRKWRRIRQAVQVLVLLLFLYVLVGVRQGNELFPFHDFFFHLDPLAGITAIVSSRSWITPMALGVITLLLAIAVGRAWCGWLCPLGTLLDWTPARQPRRNRLDIPSYWRQAKYFLLFTILIAAAAGSLTLLVLDPITLLFRTITSVVLPLFNLVVTAAETWLYGFGPLQPAVEWFDGLVRGPILTEQPFFFPSVLIAVVFVAVLALNAIRPRFWCRYLCPLGGLLGLVSKIARVRYKVDDDKCISCQRCATICPTGAIKPERQFDADSAECTTCLDCVEMCPTGAITFSKQGGLSTSPHYDLSRRQFLASLGAAVIGAAFLRIVPFFRGVRQRFIRPPGTGEQQLLSECIRCGECIKVCPTGGLQPGVSTAGWEGLWTPVLVSRLGYCDYSCNSCGQVCPTEAIPRLSLEEKRRKIMGVAVIDRHRCIPWVEGKECIVCEEMCPVPKKAIHLGGRRRGNSRGSAANVQLPSVRQDLCIGCGICEYQCPVHGESAILVYPIDELS